MNFIKRFIVMSVVYYLCMSSIQSLEYMDMSYFNLEKWEPFYRGAGIMTCLIGSWYQSRE